MYFSKRVNRATDPGDGIPSHKELTSQLDYEAELAVILKKDAKDVALEDVEDYIFGYTIMNDVSAREVQTAHRQWYFGKSLDGFTPLGPWIVTADSVEFPPKLRIQSRAVSYTHLDVYKRQSVQYTVIQKLSGGERRRLYLLKILMSAPNVLILDEPTNDLDIKTLMILEDYLDSFQGIVITVSHDRYFLDRVVRRIFAFEGDGVLRQYEGGFTDYAARKAAGAEAEEESRADVKPCLLYTSKRDTPARPCSQRRSRSPFPTAWGSRSTIRRGASSPQNLTITMWSPATRPTPRTA